MKRPNDPKVRQTFSLGYEYEDDLQNSKFENQEMSNKSGSNKNQYNIQPPTLDIKAASNKGLGTVHMTNSVVMQEGTDLVHRTTKNRNTLSPEKGWDARSSHNDVKKGFRRLLVEKELEGMYTWKL